MYILVLALAILSISFITKKNIIRFNSLMIVLLLGLRYDVGLDYKNYENNFYNLAGNYEIIYEIILIIARRINGKFYTVTILISIILLYFFYKFLKESNYSKVQIWIAYILFIISGVFFDYNNAMRQSIAVLILFYASKLYDEKKIKICIMYIFLAVLAHKTAIILPFFYFFVKKIKISKKNSIFIILILFMLNYILSYQKIILFLNKIINFYPENKMLEYLKLGKVGLNLGVMSQIVVYILVILISKNTKNLNFNSKLYFLGLCFRIVSIQSFLVGRIGIYLYIYMIPFIIENIDVLKPIKRKIICTIILLIQIIFFLKQGYFTSDFEKNKYKSVCGEKIWI